jgi:AraC-like DNA-binding protein
MVHSINNITEHYVLSPDRRERYLRVWESEGRALMRLGVLAAGVAELVPPYRIERSKSEHHVLIYTLSGNGNYGNGHISPGKLFVYPAGYQLYWSDVVWDMIWFHVKRDHYPILDTLSGPAELEISDGLHLKTLMNAYCDEQATVDTHSIRAIENYAELIAIHLDRTLDAGTDPLIVETDRRLAEVWAKVEDDPANAWSIAELARAYGLSSVQFHRTVVKHLNTSPMRKVVEIRLNVACQLLLTSGLTLEAIAEEVGFSSPFSLSRAFKRQFGLSPRAFRDRHFSKP